MEKGFKFVGFWKRVLITIIDIIIFYFYSVIIFFLDQSLLNLKSNSDLEFLFLFFMLVLLPTIILFLLWKYKGASIGKIIFKVSIVDVETYSHPTDKQLLYRLLGNSISNISFLLSYIHIGVDSRKQAWHDKFSNTVLVKKKMEHLKPINILFSNKRDKTLIRIETVLFIIFTLVVVVFIFFTFYDEPLKLEAKEWLFENSHEEYAEENGFYFLVGLDCLEEDDPFQEGYKWVQNQNKKATNEYEEVEIVFTETWTDEEKVELENKKERRYENDDFERIDLSIIQQNLIINDSCNVLNYYVNNRNLIDSLKVSLKLLNERYFKLKSYAYFEDTIIPHYKVRVPLLVSLITMKRLNLAWIGKEYKLGNKQKAIAEFSKEISLSRFLMKQSNFLVGKLVATVMLDFDLHLLSELIDESNDNDLKSLLPINLTSSEKYWKQIAISIFNTSICTSYMLKDPSYLKANSNGKISGFLFKMRLMKRLKLNKTINWTFIEHNFLYHLSQLNAKEFNMQKEKYPELEITYLDRIFDPTGSIFTASVAPIYLSYLAGFHDIDGYINMLKLKFMIKDNYIESNEIQSFINTHRDSLFNPYTEKAIKWNPEKSILYFEGPHNNDSKLKEMNIKL